MEDISRGMSTYRCWVWPYSLLLIVILGLLLTLSCWGRDITVPDRLFGLNDMLPTLEVPDYLEPLLTAMELHSQTKSIHERNQQQRQRPKDGKKTPGGGGGGVVRETGVYPRPPPAIAPDPDMTPDISHDHLNKKQNTRHTPEPPATDAQGPIPTVNMERQIIVLSLNVNRRVNHKIHEIIHNMNIYDNSGAPTARGVAN